MDGRAECPPSSGDKWRGRESVSASAGRHAIRYQLKSNSHRLDSDDISRVRPENLPFSISEVTDQCVFLAPQAL